MAETFLVDAYNSMAVMLSAKEREKDLETCRRTLEARLRIFSARNGPGTKVILVYDGKEGMPAPGQKEKGLEIRFSRPPRTADDLVLQLCWKLEGEPGLHVVTSDFSDIGSKIQRLRLKHLTSAEFARLVWSRLAQSSRREGSRPEDGKPQRISSLEVAEWVREFGFEDDSPQPPGSTAEKGKR